MALISSTGRTIVGLAAGICFSLVLSNRAAAADDHVYDGMVFVMEYSGCPSCSSLEKKASRQLNAAQRHFEEAQFDKAEKLAQDIIATIRKNSPKEISSKKPRYAIATYTGAQYLALKSKTYGRVTKGDLSGLSSYSGSIVSVEFGSAMGNFTVQRGKEQKSFFVIHREVIRRGSGIVEGATVTVYFDPHLKTGDDPEAIVVETAAR